MIADLKTDDEEGRARSLERYNILDTEEEKPFENVVNLVQMTLNVPICAVSLVDRHRQWFKARRGLGVQETPRDISFCTHAIQQDDPFVVSNATQHPLFKDSPLVTCDPNIRAYAGIPLKTPDGYNIGSLCAIDDKPREFQSHEISILQNFANIVIDEFELRQVASCDGLTGALTRRAWCDTANAEIERATRYARPLGFAIMDIDKFKSVNDTYGHPAGDKVIQRLASRCLEALRQSDFFGRFGGEEFALLMTETEGKDALLAVERLRSTFEDDPIDIGESQEIHCTFSAGIAQLSNAETLETLIARADKCLYEAKEQGRNRSVLDNSA